MKYNLENINSLNENVTFDFFKHYDSKILRKFKKNYSVTVKTEYGKMDIRNRLLNTKHRDIIGAIFKCGSIQEEENGDIAVFVHLIDVLKELGMQIKDLEILIENIKQISDVLFYILRESRALRILKSYECSDNNLSIIFSQKFLQLEEYKFI